MTDRPTIQITLTPEQKEQLMKLTGRELTRVRLNIRELEARITPGIQLN